MRPYQRIVVAALLFMATLVTEVDARGTMIQGTIMSTSPGVLVVLPAEGDPIEFVVSSGTRIIRDGEPAKLEELQTRDQVSVVSQQNGPERMATDIFARSPF